MLMRFDTCEHINFKCTSQRIPQLLCDSLFLLEWSKSPVVNHTEAKIPWFIQSTWPSQSRSRSQVHAPTIQSDKITAKERLNINKQNICSVTLFGSQKPINIGLMIDALPHVRFLSFDLFVCSLMIMSIVVCIQESPNLPFYSLWLKTIINIGHTILSYESF